MAKRRRKSGLGILQHRGASQTSVKQRAARQVTVKVNVWRHRGARRAKQFCADAYIARPGRASRHARHGTGRTGMRSGAAVCGSTPTKATQKALVALGRARYGFR